MARNIKSSLANNAEEIERLLTEVCNGQRKAFKKLAWDGIRSQTASTVVLDHDHQSLTAEILISISNVPATTVNSRALNPFSLSPQTWIGERSQRMRNGESVFELSKLRACILKRRYTLQHGIRLIDPISTAEFLFSGTTKAAQIASPDERLDAMMWFLAASEQKAIKVMLLKNPDAELVPPSYFTIADDWIYSAAYNPSSKRFYSHQITISESQRSMNCYLAKRVARAVGSQELSRSDMDALLSAGEYYERNKEIVSEIIAHGMTVMGRRRNHKRELSKARKYLAAIKDNDIKHICRTLPALPQPYKFRSRDVKVIRKAIEPTLRQMNALGALELIGTYDQPEHEESPNAVEYLGFKADLEKRVVLYRGRRLSFATRDNVATDVLILLLSSRGAEAYSSCVDFVLNHDGHNDSAPRNKLDKAVAIINEELVRCSATVCVKKNGVDLAIREIG